MGFFPGFESFLGVKPEISACFSRLHYSSVFWPCLSADFTDYTDLRVELWRKISAIGGLFA
jgi:hypothetical protein